MAVKKAIAIGFRTALRTLVTLPSGPLAVAGGGLAGVTVYKLLLKLEDAISREDFKNEVVDSIRESLDKFKIKLFGAQ